MKEIQREQGFRKNWLLRPSRQKPIGEETKKATSFSQTNPFPNPEVVFSIYPAAATVSPFHVYRTPRFPHSLVAWCPKDSSPLSYPFPWASRIVFASQLRPQPNGRWVLFPWSEDQDTKDYLWQDLPAKCDRCRRSCISWPWVGHWVFEPCCKERVVSESVNRDLTPR